LRVGPYIIARRYIYRDKVARLEATLADPTAAAEAAEALRSVIDAILVYPGERRGEVRLELRGDLAAFLHMEERRRNGGSGEVVGTLVAGARNHLNRTLLAYRLVSHHEPMGSASKPRSASASTGPVAGADAGSSSTG